MQQSSAVARLEADDEASVEPGDEPARRLWRAVLARAAFDILGVALVERAAEREHVARTARAWRDGADAAEVAALAGVELDLFDRVVAAGFLALERGVRGQDLARCLGAYLERL